MVVVRPSASKRHNRLARILANALDTAAGPDWNADTDFDVRLLDVPLTDRRPNVTAEAWLTVRLRQDVAGRLNRFGKVRGGELVTPRPVCDFSDSGDASAGRQSGGSTDDLANVIEMVLH